MKKIIYIILIVMLFCGCTPIENEVPNEEITEIVKTEESADISTADPLSEWEKVAAADFAEFDNSGIGWGFKKIKNTEPDISEETKKLLRRYNAFYMDEKKDKTIYLTFDEGYENGYTGQILDTLKEHEIKAAFFVTGAYLERETELIERMNKEGHIVGNHTVNHPNLHKLVSVKAITDELCGLNEKFMNMYGKPMKYMRPPEGEYSERVLAVANALGYKTVFWSFAYEDWDPKNERGAEFAFSQVTPYLHNGAIILLHAVSKDNAEAVGKIIEYAENCGYRFGSLDEIQAVSN